MFIVKWITLLLRLIKLLRSNWPKQSNFTDVFTVTLYKKLNLLYKKLDLKKLKVIGGLSEFSSIIFSMGLTHLGLDSSNYNIYLPVKFIVDLRKISNSAVKYERSCRCMQIWILPVK